MSLQIRTLVSGKHKYLDLFDDEDILLSFSFAEIQDITSKNSAYSKSFTIPGTKNNNDIFNYFYDLNSVPLDFDPNDKFDASLLWDGYEILFGNIRLDGVSIQSEDYTYQITFYNQVGDLAANIGDKFLRQTDLSHISHPFSPSVILESNADYNLINLSGTTNYSYQNGKTMWGLYNIGYEYSGNSPFISSANTPLVQFTSLSGTSYNPSPGFFDFTGSPVNDFYFKPTIQIKELYSSIVKDAGYEITSNFFDTSYFQRFYLPLKFLDETPYTRNSVIPCYEYTNPIFDFDTFSSASTNPTSGLTCNNLNLSGNSTTFIIPDIYQGSYTFNFQFIVLPKVNCQFDITNIGPGDLVFTYLTETGSISQLTILSGDIGIIFTFTGSNPQIISGFGSIGSVFTNTISFNFNNGTTIVPINFYSVCTDTPIPVDISSDFIISGNSPISFFFEGENTTITDFKFSIVSAPRFLISGQTFDYALEFPENDYKQIDFITSINRYFNLIVVPSPDFPNTLIIEPIVDYIGKGQVLDWTTKVDYNSLQSVAPTTQLVN